MAYAGSRRALLQTTSKTWWNQYSKYQGASAIADLRNDRYALPALGPELVTNGTFNTDLTGWNAANSTLPSTVTWSAGVALYGTNGSATARLQQAISTVAGKLYVITYTGTLQGNGFFLGTSAGASDISTNTATGKYFTALGSSTFLNTATVTNGLTLDNISVKEVLLGNYGAEQVVNANWQMSISGGTATATNSPSGTLNLTGDGTYNGYGAQSFTTVVGQSYSLIFTIATNTVGVSVGTAQYGTQIIPTAGQNVGTSNLSFVAASTTTWVTFNRSSVGTTAVSAISLRAWTPAPVLRSATFAEFFAYTAASTTARTYVNSAGLIANNLAADQPRFDYTNGVQQLALNDAGTNKCTNYNANPTDLTNIGKSGDAAATLTVVDDTAALVAAKLNGLATSGKVYKLDNSAGSAGAFANISGTAGNTNVQTLSVYARSSAINSLNVARLGTTTGVVASRPSTSYTRIVATGASVSADNIQIRAQQGYVVYFILNQLEESSFAGPVIPTAGSAVTRAIETARFSPLVEAILQRSAASVVVRGRFATTGITNRVAVGSSNARQIMYHTATNHTSSWNASQQLTATGSASPNQYGSVVAFDSSGRALTGVGETLNSDAYDIGTRTTIYLGRNADGNYGDGWYDELVIFPSRLSATLQAQARPYP